ncbi:response regulator [Maricaulis sp.]|uniref:response regulator n=1 Tax=Maricaulis sp. TaxID=1486257 RepID=UPI002B2696C7|nr:response regulator [Maricaulis sp.]
MPNETLAGLTILVVEDVTSIRSLVVKLLERLGCEAVCEAADGETAWHHLKRRKFDAVLLDFELQSDDGVSIAWRIRGDDGLINKAVPIVLLTAHDEARIVEAASKAGVDDYLVKPVMPDRLGLRIRAAIDKRQDKLDRQARSTEVSWKA